MPRLIETPNVSRPNGRTNNNSCKMGIMFSSPREHNTLASTHRLECDRHRALISNIFQMYWSNSEIIRVRNDIASGDADRPRNERSYGKGERRDELIPW